MQAPPFAIEPFHPPPWLRGGHIASMWARYVTPAPTLPFRRERLSTPDDDFIDLDWVGDDGDLPVVVACHGLEGSSQSAYILRLLAQAQARGWSAVGVNYRGCSGEDNRRVYAYHSGFIDDLDLIAHTLAARRPRRPILLVGYSLGASIAGNWLGRQADRLPRQVRAAFLCSTPFLLAPCSERLEQPAQRLYLRHFLQTLRAKAIRKAEAHPGTFDADAARRARSLRAFDDAYTRVVHGFASVEEYYEQASCGPQLQRIRVPTLILNARNDPLIPAHSTTPDFVNGTTSVRFVQLQYGGHVGFICESPNWLERQILAWFDTCLLHAAMPRTGV